MLLKKNHGNAEPRNRAAGEWLREQRRYWQITQAELAEQTGIGDASLIEEIERGKITLPRVMQAPVALAFGLDRDALAAVCETWYGRKTAAAA